MYGAHAMTESIDYGQYMYRAMKGLMAEVLAYVARSGLPGDHHLFITFDTSHPEIEMPDHLRRDHPERLTIVLQNWFQDLEVSEGSFSVVLSFNNRPERIVVPFDAIQTFIDPTAEFGLRFESSTPPESDESEESASVVIEEPRPVVDDADKIVSLDAFRT